MNNTTACDKINNFHAAFHKRLFIDFQIIHLVQITANYYIVAIVVSC